MSGISVRLSMLMVALALIVAIAAPGAAGALPGVGPGDGPITVVAQDASRRPFISRPCAFVLEPATS